MKQFRNVMQTESEKETIGSMRNSVALRKIIYEASPHEIGDSDLVYPDVDEALDTDQREALQMAVATNEFNISSRIGGRTFEDKIARVLAANGIRFASEQTLQDLGRRTTPDFLLLDDVYINGSPVRWLEVKSFFGAYFSFACEFENHTLQQVGRYSNKFGPGALVFKGGFAQELKGMFQATVCIFLTVRCHIFATYEFAFLLS